MTDKQQIERLKEALYKYARAYGKSFESAYGLYTEARMLIDFGMLPLLLPENAVVLTREEYDCLLIAKDFDYGYHEGKKSMEAFYENIRLPEVRKEMAKEIFSKLIEVAGRFDGKLPIGVLKAWAIEYGVEVCE